jgi:hypothetical protein
MVRRLRPAGVEEILREQTYQATKLLLFLLWEFLSLNVFFLVVTHWRSENFQQFTKKLRVCVCNIYIYIKSVYVYVCVCVIYIYTYILHTHT